MHQCHEIIARDDISQRTEPFFDSRDLYAVWKRIPQSLELTIGRACW